MRNLAISLLFIVFAIGIVSLFLAGCASYKAPVVEVKSVEYYKHKIESSGLTIAIDPYDTEEKSKSAFYVNMSDKDIKPIHLIIDNKSENDYLIKRTLILLQTESGKRIPQVDSRYVFSKFEHSDLLYTAFGLIGFLGTLSVEEANQKMSADWSSKELSVETIIVSGKKTSGFVFYETKEPLDGKKVVMDVIDLKTNERFRLEKTI
jgi:hypothetical protein